MLGAIAHEMKTRDLGEYDASLSAPMNDAKKSMIEASYSEAEQWLIENESMPPLCYRLTSIQEVMDAMPNRLVERTPRLRMIITSFMKRKLRGKDIGQRRLSNKHKVRLWAINGSAGILGDKRESFLSMQWDKERSGTKKAAENDAAEDFAN